MSHVGVGVMYLFASPPPHYTYVHTYIFVTGGCVCTYVGVMFAHSPPPHPLLPAVRSVSVAGEAPGWLQQQ